MKVQFLKNGYYRNKKYAVGDIIEMSPIDVNAYLDCRVVKLTVIAPTKNKTEKDYNNMTYKEICRICKNKGIKAVGKKKDLISLLTGE